LLDGADRYKATRGIAQDHACLLARCFPLCASEHSSEHLHVVPHAVVQLPQEEIAFL
jgi:hypothetical protein